MQNKNNFQISLLEVVIFWILLLAICFGFLFSSFDFYVNIANYISMFLAILGVFSKTIFNAKKSKRRNVCKAILVFFLIGGTIVGFWYALMLKSPVTVVNNIFTLIALMFCLCEKILQYLIMSIFKLEVRESK